MKSTDVERKCFAKLQISHPEGLQIYPMIRTKRTKDGFAFDIKMKFEAQNHHVTKLFPDDGESDLPSSLEEMLKFRNSINPQTDSHPFELEV